jgi:hypothetical protein
MEEAELIAARKRRYEQDVWWIGYQCAQVKDGSLEDAAFVVWENRYSNVRWPGDPNLPLPPAVDASSPGYGILLPDGTSRRVAPNDVWPMQDKVRHRLQVLHPNASKTEVEAAIIQAEQLETYAHDHYSDPVLHAELVKRFPRFSKRTINQAISHAQSHMSQ